MPVRDTMTLIAALKPRLIDKAVALREDGSSYDAISLVLTWESSYPVGREVVRRWFVAREAAAAPTPDA